METAAEYVRSLCSLVPMHESYGVREERKMPTLSHSKEERDKDII